MCLSLGYLSPAFTQRSRAFILENNTDQAEEKREIQALLFIYSGLTIPTIWTYGSELMLNPFCLLFTMNYLEEYT